MIATRLKIGGRVLIARICRNDHGERPVFRTPPNGLGLAIHASLSKISNEIESSARAIGFRGRAVVEGQSITNPRSDHEGWTK
jgi:hypothetical protein